MYRRLMAFECLEPRALLTAINYPITSDVVGFTAEAKAQTAAFVSVLQKLTGWTASAKWRWLPPSTAT